MGIAMVTSILITPIMSKVTLTTTSMIIDHARSHGIEPFKGSSTRVSSGESLEPIQSRYDLVLSGPDDFLIQVAEPGYYVLFTEHQPDEFSARMKHEGTTVEAHIHEEYPSAHDHPHPDESPQFELESEL